MRNLAKRTGLGERGVIFVMLSVSLVMILPLVGLAFDCGMLYLTRTKLSAAVDAAVLAGARSLNRGMDLDSQRDSAEATAIEFFNANFPEGTLGATNTSFQIQVAETGTRTRTVTMTAQTNAPLYFLRVLQQDASTLRVGAQASRRDVNLILVLDRSASIAFAGADDEVRASAKIFADKFAEGRDRLGLLSFSGYYSLDFAYGMDFKTRSPQNMFQVIDGMNFPSGSAYTNTARGLYEAYKQIQQINEVGALNVIVFFTDGRPTALTTDFPVKTLADQRYGDGMSPYGGMSTLYSIPASTCSSPALKFGYMCANVCMSTGCNPFPATGTTYGMMKTDAATSYQDDWLVAPDSSGCSYAGSSSYRQRMRRDIAYIPDTDPISGVNIKAGYKSPDVFPTGHPYAGFVRPDMPRAVRYAAYNLANNTATLIRSDASLAPFIYTLGLGGFAGEDIDHELLKRIANDPTGPAYVPTQPTGIYVYAPTPAQLTDAFVKIASEILRLTQ